MIDRVAFLADAQKLVTRLEKDLRARCDDMPEVGEAVEAEYRKAKDANRTGQTLEEWRADAITQQAVAWVLSCVFVRFLEDNRLIDPPRISGPVPEEGEHGENRLARARDEHELFFRRHPHQTDRDYLLAIFDDLAGRPGTRDLFGPHNPLWAIPNWLSPDAAKDHLLPFFQRIDAGSGRLVHDFTEEDLTQSRKAAREDQSSSPPCGSASLREDPTRFLGDLYQDLSEAARKKYALLQTPVFVEEFILDRTLTPAIETFGLEKVKLIDPACGSGHFLLGAFARLLDAWTRREPATPRRELVRRALDAIHGVDLNPYAVAIARFRLLLAAWRECGVTSLANAPQFGPHLACGDSLLHGVVKKGLTDLPYREWHHHYQSEDATELDRLLQPGTYHAVVGNPPYITPKDRGLNEMYRSRYSACHMKYSLSVPFMQRIFDLACEGGFTGQITANSFMKREFGKKLITDFFKTIDLTHVIDTSGAYIPGHGTPTVILFGRNRPSVPGTIRAVLGIRGEPTTPDDPAQGLVWSAIVRQIDQAGSQSAFVSVADSERIAFHRHPWSIGGGGAAELKEQLEAHEVKMAAFIDSIGFMAITGEDELLVFPRYMIKRWRLLSRPFRIGDLIRDWRIDEGEEVIFPYDASSPELRSFEPNKVPELTKALWPQKTVARARNMFGKTMEEHGFQWYEYIQFIRERARAINLIAFAEVASHNHFVLARGGKVFKQTAPVIKLPATSTEDDHLVLVGLLNSSTACFWMKQVCFPKGTTTGDISSDKGRAEANRYAFSSTAIGNFPLPDLATCRPQLLALARRLCEQAEILAQTMPSVLLEEWSNDGQPERELLGRLTAGEALAERTKGHMVYLQEELDWICYQAYGLHSVQDGWRLDEAAHLSPGSRPFCWIGSEGASQVPPCIQTLYIERRRAIERDPALRLIESVMYKRPWLGRQGIYGSASRTYTEKVKEALHAWLLDRLESYFDLDGRMKKDLPPSRQAGKEERREDPSSSLLCVFAALREVSLYSLSRVADIAARDPAFQAVASLYRGRPDFDVTRLVTELIEAESVPLLPVLRYKPSGLDKRQAWERTWELQRREDAIDARATRKDMGINEGGWSPATDDGVSPLNKAQAEVLKRETIGTIPPPPKYKSTDFQKGDYWRLRGGLDVPKERWVIFPHCEGPDGLPLVAWAGYDHLQLAQAIAAHYVRVQEQEGGRDDPRLVPLLACLAELLPWLKQWHNAYDAEYGVAMGDYYEGFVQDEARQMGNTVDEVRGWQPPAKKTTRKAIKPPSKKEA